jgi:nitrogen fixation protein FixH
MNSGSKGHMKQTSRTGWNPWPVAITIFFACVIPACVGLVIFCSRHPADLVAADYYEQEVRYQGQIDRLQHAQQRAQLASVAYNATSKQITISLPTDVPLTNVMGTITLYRPAAMNQDRTFKFEPGANGVQNLDASGLVTGLWKVRVSWTIGQEDYFLDQEVVIPTKSS